MRPAVRGLVAAERGRLEAALHIRAPVRTIFQGRAVILNHDGALVLGEIRIRHGLERPDQTELLGKSRAGGLPFTWPCAERQLGRHAPTVLPRHDVVVGEAEMTHGIDIYVSYPHPPR